MEDFKHQLLVLKQLFRCLPPADQTQALSLQRDTMGECQNMVRTKLASDAMKTIHSVAENLIQETYGRTELAWDDSLASPRYLSTVDTSDNGDLITNALYDTLRKNEGENSRLTMPSPLPCSSTTVILQELEPLHHNTYPLHPLNGEEVVFHDEVSKSPPQILTLPIETKCLETESCEEHRLQINACEEPNSTKDFATNGIEENKEVNNSSPQKDSQCSKPSKTYPCPHCDYIAIHRQNLHRHRRNIHMKSAPTHPCTECGKEYKTRSAAKEHFAYAHQTLHKIKCSVCSRRFVANKDLNRHMKLSHDGKREHECWLCHAAFKLPSHLKRHLLKVHDVTINTST